MKKILSLFIALTLLAFVAIPAIAAVNTVTPSTNDINRTNSWAHVDVTPNVGSATVNFISTRNWFLSCFEYRTDGDTSQASGSNNYNINITDGLYPFFCQQGNSRIETIPASEYIEIRMVFGAERDERFDWTRFDVLSAPIVVDTTPPSVPTGIFYIDTDNNKNIQCNGVTNTKHLDVYWNKNTEDDFSHYEYVSYNADGTTGPTRTFTESYFDASFWTIPMEGTYGVQIRAVDESGNPSDWFGGDLGVANSCKYIVDWTAPSQVDGMTIWQDGVDIGCGSYINKREIKVDWNNSTDINFAYFRYQADDLTPPIDFTTTLVPSERSGSIRDLDGTYQYRAQAIDLAGNTGDWSDWCKVTLDRVAPDVEITTPDDGSTISGTVEIKGTVQDINLLRYYFVILNSKGTKVAGPGTVITSDIFTNKLLLTWNTVGIPDGEYTIKLEARDKANNKDAGSSDWHTVTVKNTSDEPVLTGPPTDMNQCKKDGWREFDNPTFKNQGQCVSYVQSNEKAGKRNQ